MFRWPYTVGSETARLPRTHEGRLTCYSSTAVGVRSQQTSCVKNSFTRCWLSWAFHVGGFHAARHGATSALLADGATPAVVQKQLRHSDPRITLGIYGHVIGNQQRDAVEKPPQHVSEQFAVN